MFKLGVTGGIASGKSTVTRTLRELGAIIIDADEVAHHIIEPGQPAWQDIIDYFGPEVLDADRSINRPRLGEIVFNDHEKLVMLNRFTHPRVYDYYRRVLGELEEASPSSVVVLEIPLLFESGMQNLCDQVWVIWLDEDTQVRRLMERNGFSREAALNRIHIQMPLEEKARRADLVIDNTRSMADVAGLVRQHFTELQQKL